MKRLPLAGWLIVLGIALTPQLSGCGGEDSEIAAVRRTIVKPGDAGYRKLARKPRPPMGMGGGPVGGKSAGGAGSSSN